MSLVDARTIKIKWTLYHIYILLSNLIECYSHLPYLIHKPETSAVELPEAEKIQFAFNLGMTGPAGMVVLLISTLDHNIMLFNQLIYLILFMVNY